MEGSSSFFAFTSSSMRFTTLLAAVFIGLSVADPIIPIDCDLGNDHCDPFIPSGWPTRPPGPTSTRVVKPPRPRTTTPWIPKPTCISRWVCKRSLDPCGHPEPGYVCNYSQKPRLLSKLQCLPDFSILYFCISSSTLLMHPLAIS